MAARRRYVRRRAPPRRYRRAVRKTRRLRKKFFRRRRTGNFTLLCRKVSVIAVPNDQGYSYQVAPTLNDYAEVQPFLNNFEAYRIWNVKVKITPLFNVAESGNPVPKYYSDPSIKSLIDFTASENFILDEIEFVRISFIGLTN